MRLIVFPLVIAHFALIACLEEVNFYDGELFEISPFESAGDRTRSQTRNSGPNVIDLTQDTKIDINDLTQYVILQRHLFTAETLKHVVQHEPQSVVLFRDTNTVLIPHRDVLDMTKEQARALVGEGQPITYEEVDINDCLGVEMSGMLIPATGCLKRGSGSSNPGQGLLAFRYSISIEYSGQGDLSFGAFAGLFNFSAALSVTKRLKVARTVSFAGVHTCDMMNSLLVRLFYRPGTVEMRPRTRRIRYRLFDRAIEEDDWVVMLRIKLLVESVPQYYCATDRFMDLRCHETTSEYHDADGNMYNSTFEDNPGGDE